MVPIRRYAGNWRTYLACGGLILILGLLLSAILVGRQKGDLSSNTNAQQRGSAPQSSSDPATSQSGLNYASACYSPKSTDDTNFCIQRETLKASQKQAFWAGATFFIGVFGTAAILITLIWTVRSGKAAERSADAAIASVSTSLEVGRAQVRAYINITEAKIVMEAVESEKDGGYVLPFFSIKVKNFGNSPAIGLRLDFTAVYAGVQNISLRGSENPYYFWGLSP